MEIQGLYKLYIESYLVDTDTRTIRNGSIFFALKGDNFNGNQFAEEALKKGASYAIIDEKEYVVNQRTILVDNALETLQGLASYHRNQLSAPIIGLTGSNGKTTTKELIKEVLMTQYHVTATEGNLNNHIGVPLTLLSMTPDTEIGIVEMGANHVKEIEFLSSIANPDYGYITNFGKAHLEGFGGVEGVIKGKSELYQNIRQNSNTVFVNSEDSKQVELTEGMHRIFLDREVSLASSSPFLSLEYQKESFKTQLTGVYNFFNIVVAFSIGKHFNIKTENIKKAIERYAPNNNRSQIINTSKNKIILDAYNANPSSVKAALENLANLEENRKLAILGDMLELGEYSIEEHQGIIDLTKNLQIDTLIVGPHFFETNSTNKFKSFDSLVEHCKQLNLENHTILIKGSRGMKLERLLKFIN